MVAVPTEEDLEYIRAPHGIMISVPAWYDEREQHLLKRHGSDATQVAGSRKDSDDMERGFQRVVAHLRENLDSELWSAGRPFADRRIWHPSSCWRHGHAS